MSRENHQMMEERHRLEGERIKEQEKLSLAIQSVLTLEDNPSEIDSDFKSKQLPKLKEDSIEYKPLDTKRQKEMEVIIESNEGPIEKSSKSRELTAPVNSGLNAEEIHKRSEYLRKQRDKLLEIKKQERNKQMNKVEEQELLAKRPKSARAMRSVNDHNAVDDESDANQSLAFRRSLAARLKAEVIGKY